MSDPQKDQKYDESSIQVLEGLEPVRKVPGMYTRTENPLHVLQEVIDNAIDEAQNGHANRVDIVLHKDGSASVEDNGRGIPVGLHPEKLIPVVVLAYTRLHAGAKFAKGETYGRSGGLHGVGVSVTNALSTRMEVEVKREGGVHRVHFLDGDREISPVTRVGDCGPRTSGTRVRFWPDPKFFDSAIIPSAKLEHLLRSKAMLLPGLKVVFRNEITGAEQTWQYEDGLRAYLNHVYQGASALTLDAQARLTLPARDVASLQEQANGRMTLTRHPDGCLLLFPQPEWEVFRAKIVALPMEAHWWRRLFLGSAVEVNLDEKGCLTVPADLVLAASLEQDVMLRGMGNHLELWDAQILSGRANFNGGGAFIRFIDGEAFIDAMTITPSLEHHQGMLAARQPNRLRKLLLTKAELQKLGRKVVERGYTVVPLAVLRQRTLKLEIGLARGKKQHDKRETIKQRDLSRAQARGEPRDLSKERYLDDGDYRVEVLKARYGKVSPTALPMLLMDEPEQSLDTRAELEFWRKVESVTTSKVQVIAATHSLY